LNFVTVEGVAFATTVDSLLALDYLVFRNDYCTMDELINALKNNWKGYESLQARAKNRAPKYGRDDEYADALGRWVMELWTEEVWKYTTSTGRRFRPGMLSRGITGYPTVFSFRRVPTGDRRTHSSPTPSVPPTARISTGPRQTPTPLEKCSAAAAKAEIIPTTSTLCPTERATL